MEKDQEQDGAIRRLQLMDKVQLVIAVCAIVVSVASFYVAWMQAESERKMVQAETWPYLQFESGNYRLATQSDDLYFELTNGGVGPAKLAWFRVHYGGQVGRNVQDLVRSCCAPEGDEPFNVHTLTNIADGIVMTADSTRLLTSFARAPNHPDMIEKLGAIRKDIGAAACYCSLLDDCYLADFKTDPKPVPACPVAPENAEALAAMMGTGD